MFARRWTARLSGTATCSSSPRSTRASRTAIDGELLRYAARFGLLAHKDDQIDEHDRYAIRAGFWREIDIHTASSTRRSSERRSGE